jgi:hypothetical protein
MAAIQSLAENLINQKSTKRIDGQSFWPDAKNQMIHRMWGSWSKILAASLGDGSNIQSINCWWGICRGYNRS